MTCNPKYNALQHDICVGHGWCGGIVNGEPSHVDDLIPESGPVSADQFVDWVFAAEGYDPADNPQQSKNYADVLRAAFIRNMGAYVIDASQLKWDVG